MNNDNDSAIGGFLSLVVLAGTAFLGYKSGHKKAYKEMNDQKRDDEILELRKQIELLKLGKN